MPSDTNLPELESIYRTELNRHGYPFQNSILREIDRLWTERKSPWIFKAAEYPVSVRGRVTHIDLVLEHRDKPFRIIGECKRANPALSNWCFARRPYTRQNPQDSKLIIQHIWRSTTATQPVFTGISFENSERIYHLGLEVKSKMKGDDKGQPKGELDKAADQVCLGVNGMIEFLAAHPAFLPDNRGKTHLLPAIFTTAQIFTSDVDLASANLKTGELDADRLALEEQKWLWLQYNLSPVLTHSIRIGGATNTIEDALEKEFCRSVAIVNPSGIEEFLSRDWWFME